MPRIEKSWIDRACALELGWACARQGRVLRPVSAAAVPAAAEGAAEATVESTVEGMMVEGMMVEGMVEEGRRRRRR